MRIKCRPDDFQVREKLDLRVGRSGQYSVYRLRKQLWNTLDVVRDLERKHGFVDVGRAGLKDRYSLSTQYLSVPGRGPRKVTDKNYTLEYIGRSEEPVSRRILLGNDFTVTARDLHEREAEVILQSLPAVQRFGFANYYDEQRLGSARHGEGFIARRMVDGHFNGALKLYLATPSPADDPKTRRMKTLVAENWGRWVDVVRLVPYEARPVVEHLIRKPRDFKGAIGFVPRSLLELFIGAYQAYFWNETLVVFLRELGTPTREISYSHGHLAFWNELSAEHDACLDKLVIPAIGPRAKFQSERIQAITTALLKREGLELGDLKPKTHILGIFFKSYERRARVVPERLRSTKPEPDDLYPGRLKLTLSMFLPAGSYATILLKRLSLAG
jgi:tRNA pseudouridine13 synthase